MDLKTAELFSRLNTYKALVKKTEGFIKWALDRVQNPYIACSFGKDSAVMLHLVQKNNPNIPVVFVSRPETNLVDNYEEIIKEWNLPNLIVVNFNQNTFDFISKSVIKTGMKTIEQNYDSFFVGLRAQESAGRRITLKKNGMFYKNSANLVRICPVAFWTEKEIAVYSITNKLPVLSTYQKEGYSARTTAGISSKTPELSLASLKARDIESYNKLLKLLPDAKYYT